MDNWKKIKEEADARIKEQRLKSFENLQGCSDGGCIIKRPVGMHTNGGCNCEKELRWLFQQSGKENWLQEYRRIVTALRFYQAEYYDRKKNETN